MKKYYLDIISFLLFVVALVGLIITHKWESAFYCFVCVFLMFRIILLKE